MYRSGFEKCILSIYSSGYKICTGINMELNIFCITELLESNSCWVSKLDIKKMMWSVAVVELWFVTTVVKFNSVCELKKNRYFYQLDISYFGNQIQFYYLPLVFISSLYEFYFCLPLSFCFINLWFVIELFSNFLIHS